MILVVNIKLTAMMENKFIMEKRQSADYLVFGWPSEEPRGGIRDFLGVVENLHSPWDLARITDRAEVSANEDWEWTVDFIEVVHSHTLDPAGSWWVDSNGTWRAYKGFFK